MRGVDIDRSRSRCRWKRLRSRCRCRWKELRYPSDLPATIGQKKDRDESPAFSQQFEKQIYNYFLSYLMISILKVAGMVVDPTAPWWYPPYLPIE